jgi:hypothetical protein
LEKPVRGWEDHLKHLKDMGQKGLTGFTWLRMGTEGVLLLTL